MSRPRIHLSIPHMSEEGYELEFVKEAFASNWIAPIGPNVNAFEHEFGEYLGGGLHCAAVGSGTAALHLAIILMGVERGNRVICSSFTFIASANPVIYQGAEPIFIDSNSNTWNMDPNLLEDALRNCSKSGKMPKAVMTVDILGQSADHKPIQEICARYGVPIVEDAAEALGATYHGTKTGLFGEIGVFSFNGNKIITTSSGGMVVSRKKEYADRARFLATQSRDPVPHYQHSVTGYNYRMSNILAGLGRGQLKVLDRRIEQRRKIFDFYRKELGNLPGFDLMPEPDGFFSTHWLTCVLIDPAKFGATREDIRLKLEESNIESRPLWMPMHLQPIFKGCEYYGNKVSDRLFELGLCLPSASSMTETDLQMVCDIIRSTHKS